jgi:hypothetical protein
MLQVTSPLLTDLYQLDMMEAYLAYGKTDTAVFEFFVRRLPEERGFLIAAEDAAAAGFGVVVVADACRGIDVDGSSAATFRLLAELRILPSL